MKNWKIATRVLFIISFFLFSCAQHKSTLFSTLTSNETGIDFINKNIDLDSLSFLDYLYFYNGAGVAIGDINNDGLPDIYFVSNNNGNKLYLNKGNFKFEDITAKAGVIGHADWSTGVTMADVNGDGFLDIYICAIGNYSPQDHNGEPHIYFQNSRNQLFINNGDNTFTESAAKWGLDIVGYNNQAVFFDYDRDGDLDMFLLQQSTHQTDAYGPTSLRDKYSAQSGGKLYRNDGDHFTDVTIGSGIYSSALGYGLGVGVADLNQDGYDDIYVSNDFHENDYYYLNQGNGTFREINNLAFAHESKFSMGNDIADINHDGWPDILTVDMLPEDEKVLKSSLGDDPLDLYLYQRHFGYNYQFSRNCLQLNTGRGRKFSDIALYSGVAATDWSWSPLIADFNLDGQNDIFVSNGIKSRPNDLDYVKFISGLQQPKAGSGKRSHDKEILKHLPDGAWHNYIFEGQADLKFADRSADWGFEDKTLSQGSAYADLDGDGDLDLVTNNMNEEAGIYRNNTRTQKPASHYLSVQLKGRSPNTFGIGTKLFVFAGGKLFYQELQTERGFLSSSEPVLHFGLGENKIADSIIIIWPDNTNQRLIKINVDQKLVLAYNRKLVDTIIDQSDFINHLLNTPVSTDLTDITAASGIQYIHREDESFIDFNRQWSIPHEISTLGPKTTVADVNGDGLDDFFICGGRDQGGTLYIQQKDSRFHKSSDSAVFLSDRNCEDVDAVFFDANGDGFPDLYVASGGNEYIANAQELKDRLYINDGKGHFSKSTGLPDLFENKSVVRVADFDHDGDLDIFIGGRADSRIYGMPPFSYLLQNDGKGNFKIVTNIVIPELEHIGMVTGASWCDVDKDGWPDLIVTGDWMAPVLFKNNHGHFKRQDLTVNDKALSGMWMGLKTMDINGDGYPDILLGNLGLNSKLKAAGVDFPLRLWVGDFMGNNEISDIMAIPKDGKYYTFLDKDKIQSKLPFIKKEYLSYGTMAGKTVEEIFGHKLDSIPLYQLSTLASVVLINDGKGQFKVSVLPYQMQWTTLTDFYMDDLDGDGKPDMLTGGNFYGTQPYEGRYDALPLGLFRGDGKGNFKAVLPLPSPLDILNGEVRSLQSIKLANGKKGILVGFNNGPLKVLSH